MEDESKSEAKIGFSRIAMQEEVLKNPEEADIVNLSLALKCKGNDEKGVSNCACTSPLASGNRINDTIKGLYEEDIKNITQEKWNKAVNS